MLQLKIMPHVFLCIHPCVFNLAIFLTVNTWLLILLRFCMLLHSEYNRLSKPINIFQASSVGPQPCILGLAGNLRDQHLSSDQVTVMLFVIQINGSHSRRHACMVDANK
ncbi:hypothetical protein PVAP13_6NG170603 [Panicum virgatum]|uniref:Uncharacterized protein n=1 Tax=Panicum virgatum TaxID=38727 RepID=A0A8T0QXQ5_PANVG|nr:hypothetical protein PVAP13_6NG170603 [Panicum virgatum]